MNGDSVDAYAVSNVRYLPEVSPICAFATRVFVHRLLCVPKPFPRSGLLSHPYLRHIPPLFDDSGALLLFARASVSLTTHSESTEAAFAQTSVCVAPINTFACGMAVTDAWLAELGTRPRNRSLQSPK